MANPVRGEARLNVEGRAYVLAFTINAMCEAEYILGKPTDQILAALVNSAPLNVVRALLWAGLRKHHPEVDLAGAGDLIEALGGAGPALEVIGEAMNAAFPQAAETEGAARPRKGAAAGTGRRS